METIAVFVNDAAHAQHLLQPMLAAADDTHWVLVACPPALTRHVGRWVSKAARRAWRDRWSDELFAQLEPTLPASGRSRIEKIVASRPLADVSARLLARLPGARLLDARRPALGRSDEPLTLDQPPSDRAPKWAGTAVATTGLAAVLALAD